jgi:hypothetical protein
LVLYRINFNGYSQEVDVPKDVHGISAVASYIARTLGMKYAHGVNAKNLEGAAQNWADSHLDFIEDELERLARSAIKELQR